MQGMSRRVEGMMPARAWGWVAMAALWVLLFRVELLRRKARRPIELEGGVGRWMLPRPTSSEGAPGSAQDSVDGAPDHIYTTNKYRAMCP